MEPRLLRGNLAHSQLYQSSVPFTREYCGVDLCLIRIANPGGKHTEFIVTTSKLYANIETFGKINSYVLP